MRRSNLIKFFAFFVVVAATTLACRYCQKAGNDANSSKPFAAEELKSEIPFSTKEPDVFQVEIVTTANDRESKIFMARDGAKRRFDTKFGEEDQVTQLETDKKYLLFHTLKIYAEKPEGDLASAESWTSFLTTEWLNSKTAVKFFSEGKENNLAKYRASFGDEGRSESIIFVDEAVNLPVRQEFYSIEAGQKILTMTIELRNLKLEAAPELFAVPADFRKVSEQEFRWKIQAKF